MRLGLKLPLGSTLACVLALSSTAMGQGPIQMQPGGGFGDPSGALPPQPKGGVEKGPKTHAASGGESPAQLPTEAARLPEDPNEVSKELGEEIGSDFDPEGDGTTDEEVERFFAGIYYSEQAKGHSFQTALPPIWMDWKQGEDHVSLYGLNYYRRRSPDVDADVFFPFFWKLRERDTYTTVVGPVMHSEGPKGHDNWVAPLFFEGSGEDGHEYLHIPALLTFSNRTARKGFAMAGPLFCSWTGGAFCDGRRADEIDMGIAPFYFYGHDARSEYEVIPPLLHYYAYEEAGAQELDVWGPLWMEASREGGVFNLLPVFWHNWGEDEAHTTLLPFFHYGHAGATERTIATPLFYDHVADDGAHTFATYLYARHRGRTELDMITPLLWLYRDPDISLERTVLLPFYYRNKSNRSDDIAIFPFYASFERHEISRSWWITPFFHHEKSLTGWQTDIPPIFWSGRNNNSTHLVLAPLLWDFASPSSRQTVVFPFYWRFADRESIDQVVGNTYYGEEKVKGGTAWQFHFFPFFSYGESPQGHWWNVLYGLAGYTRDGTNAKMRAMYIPFSLSD